MSIVVSDRRAAWCLMAVFLLAAGCASKQQQQVSLPSGELSGSVTPDQLQSAVMSFADRYVIAVADALNVLATGATSPEVRAAAHRSKTGTALAAFTIAARPTRSFRCST